MSEIHGLFYDLSSSGVTTPSSSFCFPPVPENTLAQTSQNILSSHHTEENIETSFKRLRTNTGSELTLIHASTAQETKTFSFDFTKFTIPQESTIEETQQESETAQNSEQKPQMKPFQVPEPVKPRNSELNFKHILTGELKEPRNTFYENKTLREACEDFFLKRGLDTPNRMMNRTSIRKLITPRSPRLRTKERVRHERVLSTEDRILMEIKERFEGNKKKVLMRGNAKSAMKDNSFARRHDTSLQHYSNARSAMKLTECHPFTFSTDKRAEIRNQLQPRLSEEPLQCSFFKAKPMPHFLPFEVKKSSRPCVIPEEFRLITEERGRVKEKIHETELFRKEMMQRSIRKLKPLEPSQSQFRTGVKQNFAEHFKQPTVPTNFRFCTEERGERQRSLSFEHVSTDSLVCHKFKAKPMPDFSKPFQPKLGTLPLTEAEEIHFETEKRAEKREEFEKHMLEKLNEQRTKEEEDNRPARRKKVLMKHYGNSKESPTGSCNWTKEEGLNSIKSDNSEKANQLDVQVKAFSQ